MTVLFGKGKEMKKCCGAILVLSAAALIVLSTALPVQAADTIEKEAWWTDEPGARHRRFKPTEERIEQIMRELRESDPAKAKELEQLRKEDPERFQAEVRKIIAREFHARKGHRFSGGVGQGPEKKPAMMPLRKGKGEGTRGRRPSNGNREFIEWLEKNYPQEAKKLARLRKDKPKLFDREIRLLLEKYSNIFRVSKRNPQLAKSLKEDLKLKIQRFKLLRKMRAATPDEKEKLAAELKEVVSQRYDLIVKRKQIRYEELLKKLRNLKQEIENSNAKLANWKDTKFKEQNVNARVKELVNKSEQFNWD